MPGISKSDIIDVEIVDRLELASSGSGYIWKSNVVVLSTTNSNKRVVVSGYFTGDYDDPLAPGDVVIISGSSGGDGTYDVAVIVNSASFDVVQAIPNSTGGLATFKFPPGASQVGYNPAGTSLTATNLQAAVTQLALSAGPSSSLSNVDFLLENEPPTPNNVYEPTRSGLTVTQEKWKRTADFTVIKIIDYTYSQGKVSTSVNKVFATDGTTVVGQFTRNYIYTGNQITKISGTRDL
jgi:hypothetical protein